MKDNPKIFGKYVQTKVKSKPKIPDSYRDTAEDRSTDSDLKMTENLNQFSQVFVVGVENEVPE